eukprot:s1002_g29.t1
MFAAGASHGSTTSHVSTTSHGSLSALIWRETSRSPAAGKCFVAAVLLEGTVREKFKPFENSKGVPDLARIRRELPSLYNGKDVRLLFSGLDFDRQHEESQRALDSLQKYIAMAKTAGEAFPSIKQIVDDLSDAGKIFRCSFLDVLHKSQLFKKDQEAKRKLFLKERELQATMQVAERRLQQVEKEKREIEEKNRKLHEEKEGNSRGRTGKLEVDTKNVREELGKLLDSISLEHTKLKTRVQDNVSGAHVVFLVWHVDMWCSGQCGRGCPKQSSKGLLARQSLMPPVFYRIQSPRKTAPRRSNQCVESQELETEEKKLKDSVD